MCSEALCVPLHASAFPAAAVFCAKSSEIRDLLIPQIESHGSEGQVLPGGHNHLVQCWVLSGQTLNGGLVVLWSSHEQKLSSYL